MCSAQIKSCYDADLKSLGCTASIGSLGFQGGQPGVIVVILQYRKGVFKEFPRACNTWSISTSDNYRLWELNGEWDVLAQYLGRECPSQPGRICTCDGRRSCLLLSGRRPGRLGRLARLGAARWLPHLLLLPAPSYR